MLRGIGGMRLVEYDGAVGGAAAHFRAVGREPGDVEVALLAEDGEDV